MSVNIIMPIIYQNVELNSDCKKKERAFTEKDLFCDCGKKKTKTKSKTKSKKSAVSRP